MRILFDHNAPRQLRRHLVGHDVDVAEERGGQRLSMARCWIGLRKRSMKS